MPCLSDYTVTLSPSRIAPPTASPPAWGGLEGGLEIESYQKLANGTYGEGIFYLCGYSGDLKPLLDQHLEVKDNDGNVCYCGYVAETYRCCGEYVAWGWSNATLYNRIAVTWSEGGVTQITPFAQDIVSMQTHGVRELVVSLPASSLYTPTQYAQRLLKALSQPRPVLHNTYKCKCNITYLRTQGYYTTLAWQTYHNACGLADTGATFAHAQKLGLGFISDQLAINGGGPLGADGESQIGEIGAHLLAFAPGDLLLMSGWGQAQNNIVTTISDFIKDDDESVTSDGLTTSPPNFIRDANHSLIEFHPNELIQVSGTAASTHGNAHIDGYYWVRAEDDGPALEVQHQSFGHGNYTDVPVTITHGVTIRVPSNLAQEDPGAVVTVQGWHQYLCQRICNTCGEPWQATHVALAVRRVGAPTADIAVTISTDCRATQRLATATLAAADIGTSFGYVLAELTPAVAVGVGACFYIQIHPLTPLSTTDYYAVGGSLAQEETLRALTGPDGHSYAATNYTTAVRLLEYASITTQLFDLVRQGKGVTSVAVLDTLAFAAPTYRNSYTSLLYAIEQLLIMGDPDGNRLQLQLDCNGNAIIRTEPALDQEPYTTLDCSSCPDAALCQLTAGRWLCPSPDTVDVPGVFLNSLVVSYKSCRMRFIDRDFSRTTLNEALRYPGVI